MESNEFKDLLKNFRKSKNMTQETLAGKSGVSLGSIRQYERGERKPKLATIKKISDALDVRLADIIGEGSELWWEMDFETFKKESPDFEKWKDDLEKGKYGSKDQQRQNLFSDLTFALEHAPRDDEKKEAEYINRLAHIIRTYGVMSQHMCVMGLSSKERPDEYIRFMQNYERLLKLVREHKEDIIDGAFEWLKTLKESDTSKLEELIYGDDPEYKKS